MIEYAQGMVEHSRTLWRICRAVSNPLRLRMLRLIYTCKDDLNESAIRRILGIEQSVSSIYLNQLSNAGLIGAERDGVKVYFRPWAKGGSTEELCRALADYFQTPLSDGWIDDLLTQIKPYTHFNRLAMLARLMDGPATKDELMKSAGTIVRTMEHHLRILVSAGLVRKVKQYHGPMILELETPLEWIPAALLMYVRTAKDDGESFRNVIPDRGFDDDSKSVLREFISRDGLDWETPRRQKARIGHMRACDKIAQDEPNKDPS